MEAATSSTSIDQLGVDTIRTLSMDAVQKANSGHPGLPHGHGACRVRPVREGHAAQPEGPGLARPRPLRAQSPATARCCSTASLHLAGYDLSLDELKKFRQWGSLTPGHPERDRVHVTPGVEVTTGPLGQGFANGVGMAMAERFLRDKYGAEVMDHYTYAIVSDGDLMEGIAAEAASLAGQLGLGQLVYLYDDNSISLDGPTSLSFDVRGRRQALRGLRLARARGPRRQRPRRARGGDRGGPAPTTERPTLIRVKSIIGYPSPNKQGTSQGARRAAGRGRGPRDQGGDGLGPRQDVLRARRRLRGSSPPRARRRGAGRVAGAARRLASATTPTRRKEWDLAWEGGVLRRPAAAGADGRAAQRRLGPRRSSPRVAPARRRWPRWRRSCRRWSAAPPTCRSRRRPSSPAATTSATRAGAGRAQRLLGRARARHGRRGQRPGRARRHRAARTARRSCSSPTTCAARSASAR